MVGNVRKKGETKSTQSLVNFSQPEQTILPNNRDKTSSKQNYWRKADLVTRNVPSRICVVFSRFLYFPCSFSFNPLPFFFKKYFPRKGILILANYQVEVRFFKL